MTDKAVYVNDCLIFQTFLYWSRMLC